MNKKIFSYFCLLCALVFVSCEETEEVGRYDNWRARNEAFIDSLANVYDADPVNHGGLQRFSMYISPSEYIYYKVKEKVESDAENQDLLGKRPTTGSTVTVYYKGMNILRERFDGFYGEDPNVDDPDGSGVNVGEGETNPSTFELSSLVSGWQEVLQHMRVGDRWEVYIPWQYGYGSSGQKDSSTNTTIILGYSALIFDIQLLDTDYVAEE